MLSSKKLMLIGVLGGAAVAVAAGALTRSSVARSAATSVVQPAAQSLRGDSGALSVSGSRAHVTYEARPERPAEGPRFSGYVLTFAVQNHTSRDIRIPADVKIMRRLYAGGGLVDSSGFAKLQGAALVRAHQPADIVVNVDWVCLRIDGHGDGHEVDPVACYRDLWAGTDGWELLDSADHVQLTLPKPPLEK